MSLLIKKSGSLNTTNVSEPVNDSNPIRIALLGGAKSGKTSIISKLTLGNFRDTYYPTRQIHPILFNYNASTFLSRLILDENNIENTLGYLSKADNIVLSPVIYQSYSKIVKRRLSDNSALIVNSKNEYFMSYNYKTELGNKYIPPHISPILVELIDTPSFNPDQVVPFLEASLYIKLDREILKNLANVPRRSVSTNPLLVASGASELNGNIDGYFFVYSSVPSYNPPSYDEVIKETSNKERNDNPNLPVLDRSPGDTTFNLLSIIKVALDEAWKEYNTFKRRWEQGKEHDIFSFKSALKNLWKEQNLLEGESLRNELRKDIMLIDNSMDPADPNCPPPIWIICTHVNNSLKSPKLIENGIKLAKFWKCGFIAIDNLNDDIDEVLALIIKDIVERKKLRKGKKK